jgi:hypothetical protein
MGLSGRRGRLGTRNPNVLDMHAVAAMARTGGDVRHQCATSRSLAALPQVTEAPGRLAAVTNRALRSILLKTARPPRLGWKDGSNPL